MNVSNTENFFEAPQKEPSAFPALLRIGERLNTLGSRKFKQLVLDENYSEALPIALQQIEHGAAALDICAALTERSDEEQTIKKILAVLTPAVSLPLVIDTTNPDVMESALENFSGKFVLNSTNLEHGREKPEKVFGLAKRFGAKVIALTIDEEGMAKTAERKLAVAQRLVTMAVEEFGLAPQDILLDALTFTLSIGDPAYADSAKETLEGIQRIKENIPGVLTSLGVSNVSFGFPPEIRLLINNVMLHRAVAQGLDLAIVNPAHVKAYAELPEKEREMAEALIDNRPDALMNLVGLYRKPRSRRKDS